MAELTSEEQAAAKAADEAAAQAKAAEAEEAAKKAAEDDPKTWDYERGMATITKLRDELKAAKADSKRAAELETRLKEVEDASKSEEEKRAEKLAEYERTEAARQLEVQDMRLRLAVHSQAAVIGIADADLAYAALNRSEIEYSKDGEPQNVEDILKATLERHPALRATPAGPLKTGGTDGGGGATRGAGPSLTAEELEAASTLEMSPERYAAMKSVKTEAEYRQAREQLKSAGAP